SPCSPYHASIRSRVTSLSTRMSSTRDAASSSVTSIASAATSWSSPSCHPSGPKSVSPAASVARSLNSCAVAGMFPRSPCRSGRSVGDEPRHALSALADLVATLLGRHPSSVGEQRQHLVDRHDRGARDLRVLGAVLAKDRDATVQAGGVEPVVHTR